MNKTAQICGLTGIVLAGTGVALTAAETTKADLRQAKKYAKTLAETKIMENSDIRALYDIMYSGNPVTDNGISKKEENVLRRGGNSLRKILRNSYEKAIKRYGIHGKENTIQIMDVLDKADCFGKKAEHVYDKADGYLKFIEAKEKQKTKNQRLPEDENRRSNNAQKGDQSNLTRVLPGSPANMLEVETSYNLWKTEILSGAHGGMKLESKTEEIPFSLKYIMNGQNMLHGIEIRTKLQDTEKVEGEKIREGKTPMGFKYTFMLKTPLKLKDGMSLNVGAEAYWDTIQNRVNGIVSEEQKYGLNPTAMLYWALGGINKAEQKPNWLVKAGTKISPANWTVDESAEETYRKTSFETVAGVEFNKLPVVDLMCDAIYSKGDIGVSKPGAEGNSTGQFKINPKLRFNVGKFDLGVDSTFNAKENNTTTGGWQKGVGFKATYKW